jgi:hypothetical protein
MKPLRLNVILLSMGLASTGAGLGCGKSDQGSDPGSGGYGAGGGCVWGGNGGGLTFPACPDLFTSEFMGTIDGKPYDIKDSGHITATAPVEHPPYQLSLSIGATGALDLDWWDPYVRGRWTDLSGGTIILPEDGMPRVVYATSQLLTNCEDFSYLYILHVYGGDLTGCSR